MIRELNKWFSREVGYESMLVSSGLLLHWKMEAPDAGINMKVSLSDPLATIFPPASECRPFGVSSVGVALCGPVCGPVALSLALEASRRRE